MSKRNRIFSFDSAKAKKAESFGYLNAIQYLAPHRSANGKFDLCGNASPGCIALCLGKYSGHASMVSDLENGTNATRESRAAKAIRFMRDRANYLLDMVREIDALLIRAAKLGVLLCVRLNGSSDIAWEAIRFTIVRNSRGRAIAVKLGGTEGQTIFAHYPALQFVDYTKNPSRFNRGALPANYCLVFSRSETNDSDAIALLARGINVAVVFQGDKPLTWNGYVVIDGDAHDLRHLDPRAGSTTNGHSLSLGGYVIGLSPKGTKAKRHGVALGFVVPATLAA